MFITRVRIGNFRSIKEIDIPFNPTTVFVGPNNTGKTAILEAIRIALTRRWGQRGTGFTEFDLHLSAPTADPKTAPPVKIEIEFEERATGEWPADVQAAVDDIVQLDASTGRSRIILRVLCGYNITTKSFEPQWEFLGVDRRPLVGKGAKAANLSTFFQYVPIFYLEALRDAEDEFSSRSQFWGRLLRSMKIPDELEGDVQRVLDDLNSRLLAADPKFATVTAALRGITQITPENQGDVQLRAVPLKAWDVLASSELIYKTDDEKPWLPLESHGQGVQSLSVIFLFEAFVKHLLAEVYKPGSTALLALEEPETHLHPQATRSLCTSILNLSGQKLITTHSPFFIQHVPFQDIRLVRMTPQGTKISWLPRSFSATIEHDADIESVIEKYNTLLEKLSPTVICLHVIRDAKTYMLL